MKKPYIIGITGGSGAGKTTFLHRLYRHLGEENVCVLSQDNYYRPAKEQRTDEQGIENYDLPESFHQAEFLHDVKRLMNGETVTRIEYTYNNALHKPKELVFEPAPIIILEGIFVFFDKEIAALTDLKIFLYVQTHISLIRRIKRDQIERNLPMEDVLYRYENHVQPTFDKYIRPCMDIADLIVNNNHSFENALTVIGGYLKTITDKD